MLTLLVGSWLATKLACQERDSSWFSESVDSRITRPESVRFEQIVRSVVTSSNYSLKRSDSEERVECV